MQIRRTLRLDLEVPPVVLVVEDDAANLVLLRHVLETEGYHVTTADNGELAIRIVATTRPDLVLLDVGLPKLDGLEVTRRLREDLRLTTLPILLLTGRTTQADLVAGLNAGADDFIRKPVARAELVARIRGALRLRRAMVGMEAAHAIVAALANAVEAKDGPTEQHCERLAVLAARLGRRLDLPEPELDAVTYGALLHDVGKIGVPDHILAKSGFLTDDEWTYVRRHPEIGERICAPLQSFASFGLIIRHHHERWDGHGYPDSLRAGAIPLGARIVGIVDAFDAMTHDRPYRPAREPDDALEELLREAGRQVDPELVRVFADEIAGTPIRLEDAAVETVSVIARQLRPAEPISVGPGHGV